MLQRKRNELIVQSPPPTLSNTDYMLLAATAKLIAAVSTYPHEVIRTRLREQRVATPDNPHKYTGYDSLNVRSYIYLILQVVPGLAIDC